MRAYVFADTLGRTLSWKGYKLTHVINITDVGHLTDDADAGEDKMEKAAAEQAQSIWDIARHYTEAYWADVEALNIRQPAHWSIATDYVPAMIEFAESIADKHCYELDGGLYFDISTVADYGRLARAVTDDGEGRIDPVDGKRNAADFAIWRKTPPGETRQMEWDSPWGRGAPGWHLECSVMSGQLLGLPFDIHTGGIDHREIHHPNEIAQNQAFSCTDGSTCPPTAARTSGCTTISSSSAAGKMCKSAGEFLRVQLLIDKGFHPLAYRLMCLQAHYRSELEFSWEGLGAALTRLKRLVMAVEALKARSARAGRGARRQLDPARTRTTRSAARCCRWSPLRRSDVRRPQHAVALTVLEELLAPRRCAPRDGAHGVAAMDAVLGLDLLALTRDDLRLRPDARRDRRSRDRRRARPPQGGARGQGLRHLRRDPRRARGQGRRGHGRRSARLGVEAIVPSPPACGMGLGGRRPVTRGRASNLWSAPTTTRFAAVPSRNR